MTGDKPARLVDPEKIEVLLEVDAALTASIDEIEGIARTLLQAQRADVRRRLERAREAQETLDALDEALACSRNLPRTSFPGAHAVTTRVDYVTMVLLEHGWTPPKSLDVSTDW